MKTAINITLKAILFVEAEFCKITRLHKFPKQRTVFDEDTEEKEEGEIDVFPRQYSERFLLRFESLKFGLQLNLADEGDGNKKCNVSYGP